MNFESQWEPKLKKLLAIGLLTFQATPSHATNEDFGFPDSIDMDVQRELLHKAFPEIDSRLKKIDGIIKYRKDLELYRVVYLEGFNQKILKICKNLKIVERNINLSFSKGDLSKNEKDRYDKRILIEREKCQYNKDTESEYHSLYNQFIKIYKTESDSASISLTKCYALDDCRQRKF